MSAYDAARAVATGRVVVGLTFLAAPGRAARLWVGADSDRAAVRLLARTFGARDLAIGVGGLAALHSGDPAARWLMAGVLADTADAAATIAAGDAIPSASRAGIGVFATGAAVVGAVLARRVV
jgi:hypothetical protein